MPASVNTIYTDTLNSHTFLGLNSYSEKNADIFFGRDKEISRLYQLIKSNVLTIVFGKSGTGKTSLLNAGVFPKLRNDNSLPFRIRLEFQEGSPTLMAQIIQVLTTQVDKYGFKAAPFYEGETLWEFFHKTDLWKIVTPILIFDQFEEIFTLAVKDAAKKKEVDMLLTELSDLIENTIPEKLKNEYLSGSKKITFDYKKQKAKIIFAFREDFLPEMESITAGIPSVKYSRFRLMPLTGTQAKEVIAKTWGNIIDAAEVTKIVHYLTNELETESPDIEKDEQLEIEPSLLSQVCSYLDKERVRESQPKISADFLKKHSKGMILGSIYHEALGEALQASVDARAVGDTNVSPDKNILPDFIESNLITQEGFRTKFAGELGGQVGPGIHILIKKYFIREEGISVELTHDVIATIVKNDRDEKRKLKAVAEANLKAKRRARKWLAIALVAGLLAWGFFYVKSSQAIEKADEANAAVASNRLEIKSQEGRLDSIKKAIANTDPGKKIPVKQKPRYYNNNNTELKIDSQELASLEQKFIADSLRLVNIITEKDKFVSGITAEKNELAARGDSYQKTIASQEKTINQSNKKIQDLQNKVTAWEKMREHLRMYQTHIDSIIKDRKNNDSVQYRIDVIEVNNPKFKKIFSGL